MKTVTSDPRKLNYYATTCTSLWVILLPRDTSGKHLAAKGGSSGAGWYASKLVDPVSQKEG